MLPSNTEALMSVRHCSGSHFKGDDCQLTLTNIHLRLR